MTVSEMFNPFKRAEAQRQAKRLDDVLNDLRDDGDLTGSGVSLIWAIHDVPMGYTHLLKPILDKHKEDILHRLLSRMKFELQTGDGEIGRYTPELVDALTRAGLDWPELAVIRRSLHVDRLLPSERDELDEDDRDDDDHYQGMQAARMEAVEQVLEAMTNGAGGDFKAALRVMRDFDHECDDMLETGMRRGKSSIIANLIETFFTAHQRDLDLLIELLDSSPVAWPETARLPDSMLPLVEREFWERARSQGIADIMDDIYTLDERGIDTAPMMDAVRDDYLPRHLGSYKKNMDIIELRNMGRDMTAMIELGVAKNEIAKAINAAKDNLIRSILVAIRRGSYDTAKIATKALRDAGMAWTELAAIERSLSATNK